MQAKESKAILVAVKADFLIDFKMMEKNGKKLKFRKLEKFPKYDEFALTISARNSSYELSV